MNFNQWEKTENGGCEYPVIYPVPCTARHDNTFAMILHIISEVGEAIQELNKGYPYPYIATDEMDAMLEEVTDVITMCTSTIHAEGINIKQMYAEDICMIAAMEAAPDKKEPAHPSRNTRLAWLMNWLVVSAGRLVTYYMQGFNSHSPEFVQKVNNVMVQALMVMKVACGDWNVVATYQKIVNEKNYGRGYFEA